LNKSKVIQWIKNPASIAEDDTRELREIINDFPASPILHWLYLKGLQNQKSYLFNSALSRTAIASPDRGMLLKWVGQADDENFKKQKFEFKIPEEKEEIASAREVEKPVAKVEEKPIEITLPKPKPVAPKPKKKAELPPEILALLEKSKKIREGYHGETDPEITETVQPAAEIPSTPVAPEPEVLPEPIPKPFIEPEITITPVEPEVPEIEETPAIEELVAESEMESFTINLEVEEPVEVIGKTNPAETEIPVATSFEIVLEDYSEPEIPEAESVIISLDEQPRKPLDGEVKDFSSWLKELNGKGTPAKPEFIPEPEPIISPPKTPISELTFEIEPTAEKEVILPPAENENKAKAHKIELIDKFLEVRPKIKPTRESVGGLSIPDTVEVDDNQFITVTLAQIYVEQGHYNKAIEAFEILGLKYPEKNGFFADQIREIKRRK